jgi:hypothetical protein
VLRFHDFAFCRINTPLDGIILQSGLILKRVFSGLSHFQTGGLAGAFTKSLHFALLKSKAKEDGGWRRKRNIYRRPSLKIILAGQTESDAKKRHP